MDLEFYYLYLYEIAFILYSSDNVNKENSKENNNSWLIKFYPNWQYFNIHEIGNCF